MLEFVTSFVVFTLIAAVSPQILPGVKVKGIEAAALVALVFGILNLLIGWLLGRVIGLVTLPFTCLTLGLFAFFIPMIVNTILLKITDALLDSFDLEGWGPAFGMGFLFGLGSLLAKLVT